VTLKKTIGGLRPHFLSVCEPVIPENYQTIGVGFQNIMFHVSEVCTGDQASLLHIAFVLVLDVEKMGQMGKMGELTEPVKD
jgi:hypothetical protein